MCNSKNLALKPLPLFFWCVVIISSVILSYVGANSLYLLVCLIFFFTFSPIIWKIFTNQRFLLISILLSILPGMLGRFSTAPKSGTAILLTDVLVVFLVFVYYFRKIFLDKKINYTELHKVIFSFVLIGLISYLNGIFHLEFFGEIQLKELVVSLMYLARWFGYATIFFLLCDEIKTQLDLNDWIVWLKWIMFITAIFGFLQLIFYPDFFEMFVNYGWDPHNGRLLGTFFDPNLIGAFLAMNIVFMLGIALFNKENNKLDYFLIMVLLVALVLTLSRSAYLGLFFGFIVITLIKSRKLLITGIFVMLIGILLNPTVFDRISQGIAIDDSAEKHIESWVDGIHLIQSFPFLGIGYNMLPSIYDDLALVDEWDVNNRSGIENSLFTIGVTMGILGVVIYIWLWLSVVIKALKNAQNEKMAPFLRGVNFGVFGGLIAVFVCSIFVNTLFFSYIVIYMWFFASFVYLTPSLSERENQKISIK
jgi:putative inorganic carbon (hco3(-)) transporter